MRTVVTGAGGFIGSHLVRALAQQKAEVHVILRKKLSQHRGLPENVWIHKADIRRPLQIKRGIKAISPQKVFHLAAFTNPSRSPETTKAAVETNLIGTLNLLEAIDGTDCDHFINTGTCEEYGQNKAPFKETQLPDPVSPYSASKSAAVLFCNMYHRTYGYPITSLRPFLVYGPGQNKKMFVPSLIMAALGGQDFKTTGGKQTREMNYISDIVDGYLKAALSKKAIGETINLGNGKQYSIRYIAKKINEITGNRIKILFGTIPYRENEIWRLYCDNSKARKILEWEPKVGLAEGLNLTINWYLKKMEMQPCHRKTR